MATSNGSSNGSNSGSTRLGPGHALFIAVNDPGDIEPLTKAEKGARKLQAIFTDAKSERATSVTKDMVFGFPESNCTVLCGLEAMEAVVREKCRLLGQACMDSMVMSKPAPRAVVLFAGHGCRNGELMLAQGGRLRVSEIRKFFYNGVNDALNGATVAVANYPRLLLLMDCCYSGGAVREIMRQLTEEASGHESQVPAIDVITSTCGHVKTFELDGHDYSLFGAALVEALTSNNFFVAHDANASFLTSALLLAAIHAHFQRMAPSLRIVLKGRPEKVEDLFPCWLLAKASAGSTVLALACAPARSTYVQQVAHFMQNLQSNLNTMVGEQFDKRCELLEACLEKLQQTSEQTLDEVRLTREDVRQIKEAVVTPEDTLPSGLSLPLSPQGLRQDMKSEAAILVAREKVVPFHKCREEVVRDCLASLDDSNSPPLRAHLLHGEGGFGKTRTGQEVLARANDAGWTTFIFNGETLASVEVLKTWLQKKATATRQGHGKIAVMVDYAETQQTQLAVFLQAASETICGSQIGTLRVYVLCLARDHRWWSDFRPNNLDLWFRVPEAMTTAALPPWPKDAIARRVIFREALEGYAKVLCVQPTQDCWEPDFKEEEYERPLYIHMAALAALRGEKPTSAHKLVQAQIDREFRLWKHHFGEEKFFNVNEWADLLTWLCLVQGATKKRFLAVVQDLSISGTDLPEKYVQVYRGDDCDMIGYLLPDLLAERLMKDQIGREGGRGTKLVNAGLQEQSQAAITLSTLSRFSRQLHLQDDKQSLSFTAPNWQNNAVTALARQWPIAGQQLVAILVQLGRSALPWLLASWHHLPDHEKEMCASNLYLPGFPFVAELSIAIYSVQLTKASGNVDQALALSRLALAFGSLKDKSSQEQAVAYSRKSLNHYKSLADVDSLLFKPKIAAALTNHAYLLSKQGDSASRQEALQLAREAVINYRSLAAAQPAACEQDLAWSLHSLAIQLFQQGDAAFRQEALQLAREAVDIYRSPVEAKPANFRPVLTPSLSTLLARLTETDNESRREALQLARKDVADNRALAKAQPAAYQPYLAGSLDNLASRLSEQGDGKSRREALQLAREAVAIRRSLAAAQPAAYQPDLALSLNNLASRLSEQGDGESRREALQLAREAVAINRSLAAAQPAAYQPDLAGSLNNLALRLSEQGDGESRREALQLAREAMTIYRSLAAEQPAAYPPKLARSLNNLAKVLSEQGDGESRREALQPAREAMTIYRSLAAAQPAAYQPYIARSLHNLAIVLSEQGDGESRREALQHAREAVTINRSLAAEQPAAYQPDLARSLHNLAIRLSEQGDGKSRREALPLAREAVSISRSLAAEQPAAHQPDLATSLHNLAIWLSKQGDGESRREALQLAREAVSIYRSLAAEQPAAYQPKLAKSLNNLANRLSEQGDGESRREALQLVCEAVAINRSLAAAQPAAYQSALATSLTNFSLRLFEQGDGESPQLAQEAVTINRALAEAAAYHGFSASPDDRAGRLSEQDDGESRRETLLPSRQLEDTDQSVVREESLPKRHKSGNG